MSNAFKTMGAAIVDYLKQTDKLLLIMTAAASALSCLLIASLYPEAIASFTPVYTQIFASCVGIALAIFLSNLDYHQIAECWKIFAPVCLILCLLVFTPLGGGRQNVSGSDDLNWLYLGPVSFQPSELLKIAFVLTFSLHCYTVRQHINEPKTLALLVGHALIPILLIGIQGDYGSMIIFVCIFACILFVAGINWKIALGGVAAGLLLLVAFWNSPLMPTYLKERFTAVYNLGSTDVQRGYGLQQYLGRITLGSGGIFGKGFTSDDLLTSTPELYNDMMFAQIGQVLGFIGCLAVIVWFFVFCLRLWQNGKNAPDDLGRYICMGAFAVIFFQALINIGMVLCLTPVIGVTLPFFSAGGSSVISCYILTGLVMSVQGCTPSAKLF